MDYDWKQGIEGGAGGAMAGASLGPWGAAGGGALGLLSGFFGKKESDDEQKSRQMLMDYYRNIQGRQPIQLGPTTFGQQSDVRARQISLADQLDAISRGQGPSLAEQQLRSATDRNVAQQASFANSGRGGPMAAARAMNNSARLGAVASQDAAAARIQEANQARQLLGLNLHGIRGADESMSQFNAGQQNQQSVAQMWGTLKQQGMTDEAALSILGKLQGQNSETGQRAGLGGQLMAGGANMFAQYLGSRPQSGGGGGTGSGTPAFADDGLMNYRY
jgi:hypothetical protein